MEEVGMNIDLTDTTELILQYLEVPHSNYGDSLQTSNINVVHWLGDSECDNMIISNITHASSQ